MPTILDGTETVIVVERSQANARIFTCDETFKTKIKRAGHKPYRVDGDGEFYQIDKKLLSIRSKVQSGKKLSPERREVAGKRFAAYRQAKLSASRARSEI